ncbi:transporter substrate-binding domain-containing protein [Geminicoccaceae bacterium 1502E]|nr:transporter substrate-binding domain-containing protein [Geminicoccaceae bacterium 1502E]
MRLGRVVKSFIGAAVLSMVAATGVKAQVQQELSSSSVIEEIKKRGVMRVGMSVFVPWAMRSKEGELVGFEIDVARKLAQDMEVDIEFVPTAWAGIIPALLAKKFDVIVAGMSITPQRNMTVNFTTPYAHSGQQMTANKELAGDFSLEDFNSSDVTITCRRGVAACDQVAGRLFPKATLRRFDDDAQAFQEVVNGSAHAVVSSAPKPRFWTMAHSDKLYMPTDENLSEGNEAIAVRKGDPDALNFFSNWIQEQKSNGWLQERHDYWFKTQDWAGGVAAEQ